VSRDNRQQIEETMRLTRDIFVDHWQHEVVEYRASPEHRRHLHYHLVRYWAGAIGGFESAARLAGYDIGETDISVQE
jgi:hypothetical protein